MNFVLAIDLGGTKIAAALVDEHGTVGDVFTRPTPGRDGADAIIAAVVEAADAVLTRARKGGDQPVVRRVGVGTAGAVDVTSGRIVYSTATLVGWAGTPLADQLGESLRPLLGASVDVHVENDVDAHALGEARLGAAADCASALVIAIGTGIGAAVLQDGDVLRGAHHVAGEIGHLPIPGAEDLRCPCGRRGHLEALGSGVGLCRRYVQLGGRVDLDRAATVVQHAAAGDPLATRAVADAATAVGRGVAAVVTVLDPQCVVVCGGLARANSLWWRTMEAVLRAELIDALAGITLRPGLLGGRAPLIGAAVSALAIREGRQHGGDS